MLLSDPTGKDTFFGSEDCDLPPVDHIDWVSGFEWKGIFIRVQSESQSKYLFEEIKALNYLFFEYIQVIDNCKIKIDEDKQLLSNELIFPIISYASICSIIIMGSVCINKYNYDLTDNLNDNKHNSFFKSQQVNNNPPQNTNTNINTNNYYTFNPEPKSNINTIDYPNIRYQPRHKTNYNLYGTETPIHSNKYMSVRDPKDNILSNEKDRYKAQSGYNSVRDSNHNLNNLKNTSQVLKNQVTNENILQNINQNNYFTNQNSNYDISKIMNENNSFHSLNISRDMNRDINLTNFSKEDLMESILFSKMEEKHLIKVIDDLNDYPNYPNYTTNNNNYNTEANYNNNNNYNNIGPKFKFMVISAIDLIPNLIDVENKCNYFQMDVDEKKPMILFNEHNIDEKFNIEIDKKKINSQNVKLDILEKLIDSKTIEDYEGCFNNIAFKIFYNGNNGNVIDKTKNTNINDRVYEYFLNVYSKQANLSPENHKLLSNIAFEKHLFLKHDIIDNKNKDIKGKAIVMYGISSNSKVKYSLIKSNKNIEYGKSFIERTDFGYILENFAKMLENNISIDNINSLKSYMHRFGVNSSMDIFLLPKIKNNKISDLIKLNILCKMIKNFFNFHEGINFLLKINLININTSSNSSKYASENMEIINDGFFDFIKEKSISNIHKMKIYHIILTILSINKSDKKFTTYFFDNLNYVFFHKMLKWKLIDEVLSLDLFSNSNTTISDKYTQDNLILEFIETAKKRPFMFLSVLEHHLKILIDPLVKFKASVSVENFISVFNGMDILDADPRVSSYIKCRELSFYLFSKCIHTNKTSNKYDNFKDKFSNNWTDRRTHYRSQNNLNVLSSKGSKETNPSTLRNAKTFKNALIQQPNTLHAKVDINKHNNNNNNKAYKVIDNNNNVKDSSLYKINNNIRINSNNITMINMMNNRYVDSSAKGNNTDHDASQNKSMLSQQDSKLGKSAERHTAMPLPMNKEMEEELVLQRSKIWDNLSSEMDLFFPPILYKLTLKYEEKGNYKKNVNRYLRNYYYFNKIDIVKDWKSNMEMLLNDIITVDSSEFVLIQPNILLFIHSYFVDGDYNLCKELLYKIKESMKSFVNHKFEGLAMVNFIEGLLTEKKNYIECEEFFSKCLIFSLFLYGDPRGRGSFGNNFMLFPLWKVARQTCILENSLTNENFKEMFHSQDHIFKTLIEYHNYNVDINNLYDQDISYLNKKQLVRKKTNRNKNSYRKSTRKTDKISLSDICFDEDINEEISFENEVEDKSLYLSEKNFNNVIKYKYFPFPSISDVKTSYNSYFNSENFISFFIKNMLRMNESDNSYDEDMLNKLGLNCYNLTTSIDMSSKLNMPTNGSVKSIFSKKDKTAIFSQYMYDFLMDKLSYKKNPPSNIMLAWGNNGHNETTHNNYDFLSLPRVCYKLKDEVIIKIASGWEHSLAITDKKKCYSWGNNEAGQCGIGATQIVPNPSIIEDLENVVKVSCGNEHSLALVESGELYSWGKSEGGLLGYIDKEIQYTPRRINSLTGNVIDISCGSLHNIALMSDGTMYSWGCAEGGQLGHPESLLLEAEIPGSLVTPSLIEKLKDQKVIKLSSGEAHTIALTDGGKVFGWGFTSNGQLGIGFCADSFEPGQGMLKSRVLTPKQINFDTNTIIDIQCGKTFSTFINDKHELLVCGVNDINQLGIDQPLSTDHIYRKDDIYNNRCSDIVVPTPIEYFLNMKVKSISCGESHCIALIEDMSSKIVSLWSWGSNRFGQLGQGSQIKKSMPKPINYILGYTKSTVIEISCGAFHSLCILSSDTNENTDRSNEINILIDNVHNFSKRWKFE